MVNVLLLLLITIVHSVEKKKNIYTYISMHLLGFVWSTVFARHFFLLLTTTATEKIYKKSPDGKLAVTDSLRTLLFFKNFILKTWKRLLNSFQNQHVYLKRKNGGNLFCCCCCCCYRSPSLGSDSMDERREYHYHDENNRSNTSVDHEVPEIYIPQPEFLTRMPTSELR